MFQFLMPLSLNSVSIDYFMLSVYLIAEKNGESLYKVVICVNNLIFIIHLMPYFPRQHSKPDNFGGLSYILTTNEITVVG